MWLISHAKVSRYVKKIHILTLEGTFILENAHRFFTQKQMQREAKVILPFYTQGPMQLGSGVWKSFLDWDWTTVANRRHLFFTPASHLVVESSGPCSSQTFPHFSCCTHRSLQHAPRCILNLLRFQHCSNSVFADAGLPLKPRGAVTMAFAVLF